MLNRMYLISSRPEMRIYLLSPSPTPGLSYEEKKVTWLKKSKASLQMPSISKKSGQE
jgi:hypothetical protein